MTEKTVDDHKRITERKPNVILENAYKYYDLLEAAKKVVEAGHFYHNPFVCDLRKLPVSIPEAGIDYRPTNQCTCAIGPLAEAVAALIEKM